LSEPGSNRFKLCKGRHFPYCQQSIPAFVSAYSWCWSGTAIYLNESDLLQFLCYVSTTSTLT
jgi:hypothetical protein